MSRCRQGYLVIIMQRGQSLVESVRLASTIGGHKRSVVLEHRVDRFAIDRRYEALASVVPVTISEGLRCPRRYDP